ARGSVPSAERPPPARAAWARRGTTAAAGWLRGQPHGPGHIQDITELLALRHAATGIGQTENHGKNVIPRAGRLATSSGDQAGRGPRRVCYERLPPLSERPGRRAAPPSASRHRTASRPA